MRVAGHSQSRTSSRLCARFCSRSLHQDVRSPTHRPAGGFAPRSQRFFSLGTGSPHQRAVSPPGLPVRRSLATAGFLHQFRLAIVGRQTVQRSFMARAQTPAKQTPSAGRAHVPSAGKSVCLASGLPASGCCGSIWLPIHPLRRRFSVLGTQEPGAQDRLHRSIGGVDCHRRGVSTQPSEDTTSTCLSAPASRGNRRQRESELCPSGLGPVEGHPCTTASSMVPPVRITTTILISRHIWKDAWRMFPG